jgi:hypothetical protein
MLPIRIYVMSIFLYLLCTGIIRFQENTTSIVPIEYTKISHITNRQISAIM